MQFLLIRHGLPLRSEPGQGSDPDLSEEGWQQAKRLPDALARFPIKRLISSPQKRAIQTAEPVADALGLPIEIDPRLAEYDRGKSHYTPVEEVEGEEKERLRNGQLPRGIEQDEFLARVADGIDHIVATSARRDTVAVFSHGGVINSTLHRVMGTKKVLPARIDYASITRLLWSTKREEFQVAGVNCIEHVWDLLP